MHISVNGKPCDVETGATVQDLLTLLQISGRLAVEINREIVPRGQFSAREIHTGDSIEIVHAIGGG